MDHLLFRVGREQFAAELRAIDEAVDLTSLLLAPPVPGSPTLARGVCTLRGALVPLFSPEVALGVAPEQGETALVVRDGDARLGIVVDDVDDVLSIDQTDLGASRVVESREAAVLRGVIRRRGALVAVVNLELLTAICRGSIHPEVA